MMALKAGMTAAPGLAGIGENLLGLKDGGDVTPGRAYVVGEWQPELFVPGAAGRIYPSVSHTKQDGGETHLHFHHEVSTVDSTGFEELLNRQSRAVANHVTGVLRKENMQAVNGKV